MALSLWRGAFFFVYFTSIWCQHEPGSEPFPVSMPDGNILDDYDLDAASPCARMDLWATPIWRFDLPETMSGPLNAALLNVTMKAWYNWRGSGPIATGVEEASAENGHDPNDDFYLWQKRNAAAFHADRARHHIPGVSSRIDAPFDELMKSSAVAQLRRFMAKGIVAAAGSLGMHPFQISHSGGHWRPSRPLPRDVPSKEATLRTVAKELLPWASVQFRGLAHRPHSHPGFALSGVYYVSAPAGSGYIIFDDPRGPSEPFERAPLKILPPERGGSLLVFPSWMQHAVYASRNEEALPRVAWPFNWRGDWSRTVRLELPVSKCAPGASSGSDFIFRQIEEAELSPGEEEL